MIASEEMHEASLKTRGLPVEVLQYSEANMKHSLFLFLSKNPAKIWLLSSTACIQLGSDQTPGSRLQVPGSRARQVQEPRTKFRLCESL